VSSGEPKSDLKVDDAGLYWIEGNNLTNGGPGGTLHFCAFDRCAQGESVVLLDKRLFQYELDAQFIYWAGDSDDDTGYPPTIERMAKPAP
jgi:hypothetical protein